MQDDPAFLPDFFFPDHDIDLSTLDFLTNDSSGRSSILSPHSQRSSITSNDDGQGSALGLIIPSSDTGGAGDVGGFVVPEDNRSSAHRNIGAAGEILEDIDEGFNLDPGFTVDKDGNLILTEYRENPQAMDNIEANDLGASRGSVTGNLAQDVIDDGFQGAPLEVRNRWIKNIATMLIWLGSWRFGFKFIH